MRTAKYHDYTVLKIVLFVIVLIVGLLIYTQFVQPPVEHAENSPWLTLEEATCTTDGSRCQVCSDCGERFNHETIPATGHTPLAAVKENIKGHTYTEGDSYESVKYCKDCGAEVSREKVYTKHGPVSKVNTVEENRVEPTCTVDGTHDIVEYCNDCNYELSRTTEAISKTGHAYTWELDFVEGIFIMTGTCTRDGSKTAYTEANGLRVVRDNSVAPCCAVIYNAYVTYNGVEYTETIRFAAEEAHYLCYSYESRPNHQFDTEFMYLPEPKYDELGRAYYDIDEVPAIAYFDIESNQWDDNGFALGVFKCYTCEQAHCTECPSSYRYIVRIYSKDMDKRLTEDTES